MQALFLCPDFGLTVKTPVKRLGSAAQNAFAVSVRYGSEADRLLLS
jgi:hypothetical protein